MFIAVVQKSLVNFSAVKIDTTDIFIFAGIILAAIGAIWGIRKMVALGYLSSVPGYWQKRYDREQDLADYREFRDEGGFERGIHLGSFGGETWYFGGLPDKDEEYDQWAANYEPSSHVDDEDNWYQSPEDDLGHEYIGSVGDKSWYYDKDGEVYSNYDEIGDIEDDEDGYVSIYYSYEAREEYREQLMDYIDNKQEFDTEWERIEWHNQWDELIDSQPYYGKDGDIYSGHEEQGGYDDIRKKWDK